MFTNTNKTKKYMTVDEIHAYYASISKRFLNAPNKKTRIQLVEELANFLKDKQVAPTIVCKYFAKQKKTSNIHTSKIFKNAKGHEVFYNVIDLAYVHAPYHNGSPDNKNPQRGLRLGKIEEPYANKIIEIAHNILSHKVGASTVNYIHGGTGLDVYDGLSRILALILSGETESIAIFCDGLTYNECRELYYTQHDNCRNISAPDKFMAAVGGEGDLYAAAHAVFEAGEEHGITFFNDYKLIKNVTSVRVLEDYADTYGKEVVDWVFTLLEDADYDPFVHTYRQHVLTTLCYAYSMLPVAKVKDPRQALLNDMIMCKDPDQFQSWTKEKGTEPKDKEGCQDKREFVTNGKNGEGPMKRYILKLYGIQK